MVDEITPAALRARLDDVDGGGDGDSDVDAHADDDPAVSVVDIRDPASYADGHIAGAVNVPPNRLSTAALDAAWARADEVVVACYVGKSSKRVASVLDRHLDADVSSLRGGFDAWDGPTEDRSSSTGSAAAPDEGPTDGPEAPF
ncbi:rhodanese-like domain-containing protein [Halobellus rubicundus]|uniref:Rhodanese-like domain-containing protein n=1 Tax=Halobellus rubicundus TaxID=2996466 RepID=A0ABD5M9N0_9EURY